MLDFWYFKYNFFKQIAFVYTARRSMVEFNAVLTKTKGRLQICWLSEKHTQSAK